MDRNSARHTALSRMEERNGLRSRPADAWSSSPKRARVDAASRRSLLEAEASKHDDAARGSSAPGGARRWRQALAFGSLRLSVRVTVVSPVFEVVTAVALAVSLCPRASLAAPLARLIETMALAPLLSVTF